LTAPTPSQLTTKPAPAATPGPSQSPAVQVGALALALLLGFGVGVTFEQGRHAAAPVAGRTADEAQTPAPAPPPAKAASAPEAAPLEPATPPPLAAAAPRTSAVQVPAPPPPVSTLPPPEAAPQPPAPPVAAPKPAAPPAASPASAAVTPTPPASTSSLPSYRYVIRYEKNGAFAFDTGAGKFANVVAARAAALAECQAKGGRNCKFNYASAGRCIGVARAAQGPIRVSQLQPDETSAADDALEQCEMDEDASCRVVKVLCQEP
jgi:hypothetical protein